MMKILNIDRSSNITVVGHNQRDKLLVRFRSGGAYLYAGVSLQLAEEMVLAPSVGRFFHKHIRGAFPFVKLTEEGLAALLEDSKHATRAETE